MTTIFFAFVLAIIIPTLLVAYISPRNLYFIIPVLFAVAFGFTTKVVEYEGYAVSDSFIAEGSEGVILSVSEGKTHLYVLLAFFDEQEPRLVKIVRSEETDKKMQKNDGKTTKVLRFSGRTGNSENGEGSGGDAGAFELLDLNQSKKFWKG